MNTLKTRKKVLIDNIEFTVRKMGNLEQLDYQQGMRHLQSLAKIETKDGLNDKQLKEVDDISMKLSSLFINLFDDGGNQSESRKLLSTLNDEEIGLILKQIFEEPEIKQEVDETKKD